MCLSTVWSRIPTSDPFGARPQDPTVNEEINAVDEGINNPSELPHSNDETTEKEVELNKGQLLVLETICPLGHRHTPPRVPLERGYGRCQRARALECGVDFSDIIGIEKYSSVHYGVAADGVVLLYDKQMGRRVRWSLIRSAEALRFNNSGSALFKTHLTSDLLLLTS